MSISEPYRKAVTFSIKPAVQYIEERRRRHMAKQVFERFDGNELTDAMLEAAVKIFNENYGIWGEDPNKSMAVQKSGSRVRLSKDRLRAQYLPDSASCSYVRATIDDNLAGNAFACRWKYKDQNVCWITQLVVHSEYRERGVAVSLLNQLRQDSDTIFGLMSSHPAACLAAAKVFGSGINTVDIGFIRDHAQGIMKGSPITYVKEAALRGSLFEPKDTTGAISSVHTNFYVDHAEPLQALAWVREGQLVWPLGELLDGHEFLFVVQNRRRGRSRSRSQPDSL